MLDFFHELMRVSLIFFVVIALVIVAFMIAPKLKLTLPLTCFVLFCTILSPWAGAHEALAFKIIFLLIGYGIVQIGLSLKSHDPSQRANGIMTVAGGIVVTFAKEILNTIAG